jgi:hypothetical protein
MSCPPQVLRNWNSHFYGSIRNLKDHPRFWLLAQALSALYPAHTEEKRWFDGMLARKKGLGF